MSLLSVQHVSLAIDGTQILHSISLDVLEGQILGIIGPNGSGKTTFFNVLSGFIAPTKGHIRFRGKDITLLSSSQRARSGIGRVFQNFGIFREMTVAENVRLALECLSKEDRMQITNIEDEIKEALALVHLQHHAQKKASSLSGGQMRLLEIARTLSARKDLFLLDEPTAGVSPKMTGQVAEIILELKRRKKTVLIVEHDLPFIHKICDEVAVFDLGEIVLKGTPQEVRKDERLREIYFGTEGCS